MTRDEELYVESLRDDLRAAAKLLREAEWSGSATRCPWCNEWPEPGTEPSTGAHAADCPLPSLLRRISTT